MNKFVNFLVRFARCLCKPLFPVKVIGERDIPNKKSLIVGNHISGWDPLVYTMRMKNIVSFMYKSEFDDNAFLRWVLHGLDCVPVHRGEADMSATKQVLRLLKEDRSVCVFPEGTRNPRVDCLQEFHTGAALFAIKTRSPIRPFYIWDKMKAFAQNYMIVGDEFTLEEFYDKTLDKSTLEEATAVIWRKVDELRIRLNEILAEKGVRRRRRTKKEQAKLDAYERSLAETTGSQEDDA